MDSQDYAGLSRTGEQEWKDERGGSPVIRSDGGMLIISAWICAAAAVSGFFVAFVLPAGNAVGEMDPFAAQFKLLLALLSGFLVTLSAILYGVGKIVRAIYFIPGPSIKVCGDTAEVRAKSKL
ncbi:hypothetical protein OOT33_13525 [Sphingobium sp. DEHP117]|uniref:hypothetical protein n=1 Tax=Sphingobium sp. DEHP117 TaxID=2993436 RepID=UPI0027D626BA|nr:hypothetical protein [Sphingobium sp. DEHP117]MDQ4421442.1 hypothetical protein [Sphingobium sp. DEHP117]